MGKKKYLFSIISSKRLALIYLAGGKWKPKNNRTGKEHTFLLNVNVVTCT